MDTQTGPVRPTPTPESSEAGLHPEQALGGASWIAREVCGFPSLRVGERADLLWLEHDPREDIDVLKNPNLVVLDGAVVR